MRSVIAAALCAVGLSAFAENAAKLPPVKVDALSNAFALDLTAGDRVAKDEETIVVDPAWGEAASATVAIDGESSARTYTFASNDTWQTVTLAPGRYKLALTAGATNETAAFWKKDDNWEVLDLPPYSTEGIEFQADKTYLVLGQYEFALDKTLAVVDGAKFEYGAGAGFIGGKLEMPRRYRKETVEGDLYRIVEAIKGCEDNPWVVGDDGEAPSLQVVEAYTNGTDTLMIGGTGTIEDLSEIPAGIKSVEITDATVKGAEENAFTGFNNIALTLPDNWQGELPKDGVWYGATGVELRAYPMAVKNVKVLQRYPWNGLVDVSFDLMGEGSVKVKVQVTVDGVKLANPTVTGETTFDLGDGGEVKGLKLTWDAKADFGDAEKHEKIKVKLSVSPVEPD